MSKKAKIADVLATLAEVGSLRKACEKHEVPKGTFLGWVAEDEALADQYARARETGLDAMAEEIIEIADTPLEGVETTTDEKGGVSEKRGDMLGHRKLQVDSRKWLLAKCLPKKYGDSVKLLGDPENPVSMTITREVITKAAP